VAFCRDKFSVWVAGRALSFLQEMKLVDIIVNSIIRFFITNIFNLNTLNRQNKVTAIAVIDNRIRLRRIKFLSKASPFAEGDANYNLSYRS
jgi:hypothetical protein